MDMPKLVLMKLSKAEKKTDGGPMSGTIDSPDFPYGLEIRLNRSQLEKLGFDPEVGGEVMIHAKGVVTMYREEATRNGGGKPDCDANIQITELGLSEGAGSRRAKAADERLNKSAGPTSRY